MAQLALFGENIAHSPSPEIHQHFAQQFNIELDYKRISVSTENFSTAWKNFVAAGGSGANFTMPFKRQAYDLCTALSAAAQLAESVNTIKIISSTHWYGDNTDGVGFKTDLLSYYQHSLHGKKILLIGAGGAAHGILPILMTEQPKITVVANRTLKKAEELIQKYQNIIACDLNHIPTETFDVVINTASDLPLEDLVIHFSAQAIAYDLRYQAAAQDFLQWTVAQGAKFIYDGYGMLLEQAAYSFAVWFGKKPSTHTLRQQHVNSFCVIRK